MPDELSIDLWAPLDYKETFPDSRANRGWLAPTWVGDHDRRLQAYVMLASYCSNRARSWLPAGKVSDEEMKSRIECGDPRFLTELIKGAVLGDGWSIQVDGDDQRVIDFYDEWATKTRFGIKLNRVETNAVRLGDGVYELDWDEENGWFLESWDPGMFFPVIEGGARPDEWSRRVHFAWEEEDENSDEVWVWRTTYWLEDEGEAWQPEWRDAPTTTRCWRQTLRWNKRDAEDNPDAFDEGQATVEIEPHDTGWDFIPVIHVPNTVTDQFYGEAAILYCLELFDELSVIESDLSATAAVAGSPPMVVSGRLKEKNPETGPGAVIEVGEDGDARYLESADNLKALSTYRDELLERLLTLLQVTKAYVDSGDWSDVPSGAALRLMFAVLTNLIERLRLPRDDKYKLLFKYVGFMGVKAGALTREQLTDVKLKFGFYLPGERAVGIGEVRDLWKDKLISRRTAIARLKELGYPIEDVDQELADVEKDDVEMAKAIVDATGDLTAVRTRLGLGAAPVRPTPTVT